MRDDIYRVFNPVESLEQLVGYKLDEIKRHGKYLLMVFVRPSPLISADFDFLNEDSLILLVHLGMTGKLVYIGLEDLSLPETQDLLKHKHTHSLFLFDKGFLVFNDVRRFGKLRLFNCDLLYKAPPTPSNLGPDCLGNDLSVDYLYAQNKKYPALKMKSFLLEQSILSGLGNIYSDEVLFESGLLPNRLATSLTRKAWAHTYDAIHELLIQSIGNGGTSLPRL